MTENGKSPGLTATPAEGSSTKERLVKAARQVIYHQGVERTSIADVARAAGVPSGNVYYHFKTKDDLVEAAMSSLVRDGEEFLARVSRRRSPEAQLKAFARELVQDAHSTALYGCPFGSLVSELDKRDDALSRQAGDMLLAPYIDWAEERFAAMGQRNPRELATTLLATYLGAAQLSNAFRDPSIITRQARQLERWITSLERSTGTGSPTRGGG
jgi:TetR/AcrR family transcriptional repressor of nem operon